MPKTIKGTSGRNFRNQYIWKLVANFGYSVPIKIPFRFSTMELLVKYLQHLKYNSIGALAGWNVLMFRFYSYSFLDKRSTWETYSMSKWSSYHFTTIPSKCIKWPSLLPTVLQSKTLQDNPNRRRRLQVNPNLSEGIEKCPEAGRRVYGSMHKPCKTEAPRILFAP